jgi:hypothetical protein
MDSLVGFQPESYGRGTVRSDVRGLMGRSDVRDGFDRRICVAVHGEFRADHLEQSSSTPAVLLLSTSDSPSRCPRDRLGQTDHRLWWGVHEEMIHQPLDEEARVALLGKEEEDSAQVSDLARVVEKEFEQSGILGDKGRGLEVEGAVGPGRDERVPVEEPLELELGRLEFGREKGLDSGGSVDGVMLSAKLAVEEGRIAFSGERPVGRLYGVEHREASRFLLQRQTPRLGTPSLFFALRSS